MTAKTPEPSQESPTAASSSTPAASGEPTTAKSAGSQPGPDQPAAGQPKAAGQGPATAPPSGKPAGKPAGPPPARPAIAPKPRSGGAGPATVLALLALMVSVGAVAIALYSLDVAREAKSAAAPTLAPPPPSAAPLQPSPSPAVETTPSPIVTTPPPPVFLSDVVEARVPIPQADGCASTFVDVDTLRVGLDAWHEFYLISCNGPQTIRVDRKDGAVPTSAEPTPNQCAAQLAGANGTSELVLDVRVGLTFCLLTSKVDAAAQNIPQRLAIVEVKTVSADRSLTVEVSTYRIHQPDA